MDKKYLQQVAISIFATLLSIGLILYIGYHLFYGLTQKVETTPALKAQAATGIDATGYIFREEAPLRTTADGASRIPAVADGTKVGVGTVVSRMYDSPDPDIAAQIEVLDNQIAVLRTIGSSALTLRDTVSIDNVIYDIMSRIAAVGTSGNASAAASLRSELLNSLTRRTVITGSSSDVSHTISTLQNERAALTARLGACREETATAVSGYYYAHCDGYESIFTSDRALSMSAAEFESLIADAAPSTAANAGKIVRSYLWYVACFVPKDDAAALTQGRSYELFFPSDGRETLPMTLERTEAAEDGQVMLVFSCGILPDGFRFDRAQPISVSYQVHEGLRIPLSALRAVDGVSGVYILSGSIVHYRAVQILYEGADYCIVHASPDSEPPEGYSWLRQNDIVITKGRGLYEGRVFS